MAPSSPAEGPDTVRPVHAVVFDMDGTLVQARHSSWQVFRDVSEEFGLGVDSPEEYYQLFRGNVYTELADRCGDDALFARVKESLLERLRRDYHPVMIPGMVHVVRRLAGVSTLALLSSNALPVMRRVLVENDLAFCFSHVFAGDTVPDKRTAIRQLLTDAGTGFGRRCSAEYDEEMVPEQVAAAGTVLVTDTAGDVAEALEEGARAIGVSWGMHSVEQLVEAGAEFVALWPQEVGAYLARGIEAAPRGACEIVPRAVVPRRALGAGAGSVAPVPPPAGRGSGPCTGCSGPCSTGGAAAAERSPAITAARTRAVRTSRRSDAVGSVLAAASAGDARTTPGARPDPSVPMPSDELLAAVRRTCR